MKSFKPEMDTKTAISHLREIEGERITNVSPIEMGELSRVFRYEKDGKAYVIHFKDNRDSLEKERWIHDQYGAAYGLPVPKVYKIGNAGAIHYSISDQMPGVPISALQPASIRQVIPSLIEQYIRLYRISAGDNSEGYGWFTPEGKAVHRTWTGYLTSTFEKDQEGFYEGWTELFDSSFLEKDLFYSLYEKMVELAAYAPKERYLVHGDFHLGNMLAEGEQVSGIVDWEMAMYGDFMFDVAVMDLWAPQLDFPKRLKTAVEQQGEDIPHFRERLLCYQLYKGIDGLRFYAKKDHEPSYRFMKERIISLLPE